MSEEGEMSEEGDIEMANAFEAEIARFHQGLKVGTTTQPFTSLAEDNRTSRPTVGESGVSTGPDLAQKYRKVKPACDAPAKKLSKTSVTSKATTELDLPGEAETDESSSSTDMESLVKGRKITPTRRAPVANMIPLPRATAESSRAPTSKSSIAPRKPSQPPVRPYLGMGKETPPPIGAHSPPIPVAKKRNQRRTGEPPVEKRRKNIDEEEFGSPEKLGSQNDALDTTKKSGKRANGPTKPKKAQATPISSSLDDQEKELKESTSFVPTSAFLKKAGARVSNEEKELVGIRDQGLLGNLDANNLAKGKKKRKRPTAAEWEAEFPDVSSDIPDDGGLKDDELIKLGLATMTIKQRWTEAPYVWNKKGIIYTHYRYLVEAKDEAGNFKWSDEIAKKFLGMERDAWETIKKNPGFFNAKGVPRKRAAKQLVPVRNQDGKFKGVQASQEARELATATRYEIIYNKLLEPGQTSMKRMRNTRKRTEALIEEAVASNVASQQWGKQMASAWNSANHDFLKFKDAAVQRVRELEEKVQELEERVRELEDRELEEKNCPRNIDFHDIHGGANQVAPRTESTCTDPMLWQGAIAPKPF